MKFWREFIGGNNDVVHSPTVVVAFIAVVLATPVVLLASATVVFHVFVLKKGLDAPTVNLLLGMLGAATGGLGASLYSKSMGSCLPGLSKPPDAPALDALPKAKATP